MLVECKIKGSWAGNRSFFRTYGLLLPHTTDWDILFHGALTWCTLMMIWWRNCCWGSFSHRTVLTIAVTIVLDDCCHWVPTWCTVLTIDDIIVAWAPTTFVVNKLCITKYWHLQASQILCMPNLFHSVPLYEYCYRCFPAWKQYFYCGNIIKLYVIYFC